jgi:hypothetical protein
VLSTMTFETKHRRITVSVDNEMREKPRLFVRIFNVRRSLILRNTPVELLGEIAIDFPINVDNLRELLIQVNYWFNSSIFRMPKKEQMQLLVSLARIMQFAAMFREFSEDPFDHSFYDNEEQAKIETFLKKFNEKGRNYGCYSC